MTGIESPLMKASDGPFFCGNCFYFKLKGTPFCDRRERMIRWNPRMFLCSDYGTMDEELTLQTSLDWRWQ